MVAIAYSGCPCLHLVVKAVSDGYDGCLLRLKRRLAESQPQTRNRLAVVCGSEPVCYARRALYADWLCCVLATRSLVVCCAVYVSRSNNMRGNRLATLF